MRSEDQIYTSYMYFPHRSLKEWRVPGPPWAFMVQTVSWKGMYRHDRAPVHLKVTRVNIPSCSSSGLPSWRWIPLSLCSHWSFVCIVRLEVTWRWLSPRHWLWVDHVEKYGKMKAWLAMINLKIRSAHLVYCVVHGIVLKCKFMSVIWLCHKIDIKHVCWVIYLSFVFMHSLPRC